MSTGELLGLSAERDLCLQRIQDAERAGYDRGCRSGYEAGYRQGREDESDDWMWRLAPARQAARRSARNPAFAELEARRWTLRGELRTREGFARPHPEDYTGRGGA